MSSSLGPTFGAMFITLYVDAILYGVAILLVLQYFYKSFNDPWPIKALVGFLGFLASLHITCFCDMVYQPLITNFGNYPALDFVPVGGFIQVFSIYSIALISQCFFVTRIWGLTNYKVWLTAPIIIVSLACFIAGCVDSGLTSHMPRYSSFDSPSVRPFRMTFCLGAAACDISITVVLCVLLHGSRTGFRATDNMLNTLIVRAINRGAVTSVAALGYLLMYVSMPHNLYFMIAFLPMSQHYVISVVSTLNSRTSIRETLAQSRERSETFTMPITNPPFGTNQSKTGDKGVHVSTSVITWGETQHTVGDEDKLSSEGKVGIVA